MYNDVKANGRIRVSKDGNTGMSASYVRGLHMMLHNCLGRAVKERLIIRNPTEDCIVPKLEKKEMHILHPEDISAYLKEADRRGVLAMFFLELTTGLRKGELVALLWSDLDEKTMTLNAEYILTLKGAMSHRVELGKDARGNLTRIDNVLAVLRYPDSSVGLDVVVHLLYISAGKLRELDAADSRYDVVFDVVFATLALQNGVDVKTVSSILGHYDAGFTLRTYTHVTTKMQEEAAATMGKLIGANV